MILFWLFLFVLIFNVIRSDFFGCCEVIFLNVGIVICFFDGVIGLNFLIVI